MNDPDAGRNRGPHYAEITREAHSDGGDGSGLNYKKERPSVKKTPERRIRFAEIDVLAAGVGKKRGEFAIGKRGGDGEQAGEHPSEDKAARGTGLARNVGSDDENAGADHRADNDHGAVEEADGADESRFAFGGGLGNGI